jgi:hypothetical protein
MFEMDRLHEIMTDYKPLKEAIEHSIKNKIFIPSGFKSDIYKLSEEEIFYNINILLSNTSSNFACVKILDMIEWTPVKIFQGAYFIVNLNNKLWIINRTSLKCSIVLVIKMKDYISRLYDIGSKVSIKFLDSKHWPNQIEYINGMNYLKNHDAAFIKHTVYNKNNDEFKINHYLYKNEENIYYISVYYLGNDMRIYKPILFGKTNKLK